MGLVFDLAEALNLGWGAATGEAATSIREALADRAFRRAVVADVERSAGTSSAVLTTKVAKHPSFLAWLGAGAASPLDQYLDDDTLRALGVRDAADASVIGAALRESLRASAIRFASWTERQLLADAAAMQSSLGVIQELLTAHLLASTSRAFASHGRYTALLQRRSGGQVAGAHEYIDPAPDHPAHRENIWRRLSSDDGCALLLKGVGGAGKTRLLLEIAARAHRTGWHVIHLLHTPSSTVSDLEAVVLASTAPVLVLIDYPNELDGFALHELRDQLLPEARDHGIQVSFLAAARPGWLATSPDLGPFEIVAIDNSEQHQQRVSHAIALSVAPTAAVQLGDEEFRRLVGSRPMIATLIARQLEALARDAPLRASETSAIRSGDLGDWLRRRFADDGYAGTRTARLAERRELPPALCVAVALVAATPASTDVALRGASGVCEAVGEHDPDLFARRTLDHLVTAGWVAVADGQVASIHDTVVDHLMSEVVESDIQNGRREYAGVVFTSVAAHLPSAASLLLHLQRYATDAATSGRATPQERSLYLRGWAEAAFPVLRAAVLQTNDGELAAVLRLLLDPRLRTEDTASLVGDCWREWCRLHGTEETAQNVLASLIGNVEFSRLEWVRSAVEEWLALYGTRPSALMLIARIAGTATRQDSEWVSSVIVPWLSANEAAPQARRVLVTLVQSPAAAGMPTVRQSTARWLEVNGDDVDARTVLAEIVGHAPLYPAEELQGWVSSWLALHGRTPEARGVLSRLVGQSLLCTEEWVRVAVESWLEVWGTSREARSILGNVIAQNQLRTQPWAQAAASRWLDAYGDSAEARVIITRLIEQPDLRERQWVQTALRTWIDAHGDDADTLDVLARLIEQDDFASADWVHSDARRWLEAHGTEKGARGILLRLLENDDLHVVPWVHDAIRRWLDHHGASADARPLLARACQREALRTAPWVEDAVRRWLQDHTMDAGARELLGALLYDADYRRAAWVLDPVRSWLRVHGTRPEARSLLKHLLYFPALGATDWVQGAVDTWVAHNPRDRAATVLMREARRNRHRDDRWGALSAWEG
ncbi:hypothetical protein IC744_09075 [Microbacterium hominis]|uniref:hypothetical protein n=1 Tax=Microbacterium TaxID=33882 RepID=UPI00168B7EEC|nr:MULTISPECIES: hypothetical protein [Microbacterium]QOC26474.1 hypothetical protein IC745_03410 [Microbacterium hominis]QOC27652.1 hypothetical protein IC744_09075 [Microbacterium hominis]QYF97219.1 hypothetical protein KY498_13840 [Microbacterium sp. PAMC21962]